MLHSYFCYMVICIATVTSAWLNSEDRNWQEKYIEVWRGGWESNLIVVLQTRKLLISLDGRTETNARNGRARHTYGTLKSAQD
jgi:hypothetical protein